MDDLAADDFETLRADLAKSFGPARIGKEKEKVRTVVKYGIENGPITKAILFGSDFEKPSMSVMRWYRARQAAEHGKRTFDAAALRALIDAAGIRVRAMILLGINCGFGNADRGQLPRSALNREKGWVELPRPKTGSPRRCPLWQETVAALREAQANRPPTDAEALGQLAFGQPVALDQPAAENLVAQQVGDLLPRAANQTPSHHVPLPPCPAA